jgi:predicted peptidase
LAYGDEHGPLFFARPENQGKYPCFIVAPQCPANTYWADPDADRPAVQTRLVIEMLKDLQTRFRIDSRRMYVMGISLGGYGTWDIITRQPEMFAAAVPMCGGGNPSRAKLMTSTPIWVFHGEADEQVNVSESRKMVEAVRQAQGKIKYTEYKGVGHYVWEQAFREPELLVWLFSQKKAG